MENKEVGKVTIGSAMGIESQDELVAYTKGIKVAVVKAERTAAERAARRKWWEDQLVNRLGELIAWSRKDKDVCGFCEKTRVKLAVVWGDDSPLEGPEGKVILGIDLPPEYERLKVDRHDRYHVEKALRAIRTEEYKAREARRAERKKRDLKVRV